MSSKRGRGGGSRGGRGRKGDKGGGGDRGGSTGGRRDKVYDISNLSLHSGSDARSPSVTIKVTNNPSTEFLGQTLLECFYDPIKKEALRRFLWSISPHSMTNGWEVPRQETQAAMFMRQLAVHQNPLAAASLSQGLYGQMPSSTMAGFPSSISGSGSGHPFSAPLPSHPSLPSHPVP